MDFKEKGPGQVILGLAFGYRKYGAGLSNYVLSKALNISHAMHPNLPILIQSEFDPPMGGDWIPELVVKEDRSSGKYLDTREVLIQMWEFCHKKGLKRATLITHPDHQWRAIRAAKKSALCRLFQNLGS